ADQDVVAAGSCDGVLALVNHGVELLPTAGGHHEHPLRDLNHRRTDHREAGPAVRSREIPLPAQVRPPILELVPFFLQELDASVEWDDVGDPLPDGRRAIAAN